jgi:hypothetical protein
MTLPKIRVNFPTKSVAWQNELSGSLPPLIAAG